MTETTAGKAEPVVIKKYANRRLYNTETSSYVTLDHLCQMVKDGREFVVKDAKTGEDITRSVLAQIIFEEESKGQTLLPVNFLRQLITFYGQGLDAVVPGYLEATMEMFSRNQERYREYFEKQLSAAKAFAPAQAFAAPFEEMARQNLAAFERATRMFSPFMKGEGAAEDKTAPASPSATLDDLKEQLKAMQAQIDALSRKSEK